MIGKTISHYRILEKLGEGGMGIVYKAEDTKLDRTVALKFLTQQALGGEEEKARFTHEAKSAAALPHPNICTVYEIDEVQSQTFIAMEYVEGRSLKDRVESGPLKLEEAVGLAIQVAEGLQEAHEKGIVHRDMKPANVMVTAKGQAKIMDFGLAKSAKGAALTQTGTTLGTIAYMSPEQTRGGAVDGRTDIWSLGVILYELVTGQRPYKGDYEQAVVYSILNADPEPVTAVRTGVSMELERTIIKCLEKDPAVRYQTAADLIADLRHIQRSPSAAVTESRAVSSAAEPARRPRRWPYAIGAVVLVAIAIVFFRQYFAPAGTEPSSDRKMLVVLPFENLGHAEDEYFADGITDAITARLAGIHGLGVVSRQSAVQYKDTDKNMRRIGEELGVDYVLEGTVQRERPRDPTSQVRVIPQLVRIADDVHLWAETYDEDMAEVFQVQSDIAERVALELDVTLFDTERKALVAKPTDNLEAYEDYLRGNEHSYQGNSPGAVKMYEKAVALDPEFAEAWAALSREQVWLYWTWGVSDGFAKAKAAGDRALLLAPDLPETHIALGYLYYWGSRDYERALEHFTMAQRRRPSDAEAVEAIGLIRRRQGRWEDALTQFTHALEMNAGNHSLFADDFGWTCIYLRRYGEAERYLSRAISMAPEQLINYIWKAHIHLARDGDVERARETIGDALGSAASTESAGISDALLMASQVRIIPDVYGELLHRLVQGTIGSASDVDIAFQYLVEAELHAAKNETKQAAAFYDSTRVLLERMVQTKQSFVHLPYIRSALGLIYAGLGFKQKAIREAEGAVELLPVSEDAVDGPEIVAVLAQVYTRVGEYDAAIDRIETLLSIPSMMAVHILQLDPVWDPLRDNPRFQRLLEKYAEVGSW
jgi:non-specific serine/threonine protein kinase